MGIRTVFVAGVVVLLAATAAPAQAPIQRYPWDQRPGKCFGGGDVSFVPECRSPDWPSFLETKQRVDRLLAQGDFDLLERATEELGYSDEQFPSGEYRFEALYLSMELFRHSGEHGAGLAKRWADAKGREGYARFAEALAMYGLAWEARGRGYANTVTPEGRELYEKRLLEADAILDGASPRLQATGPWHVLKVHIAFEHPALEAKRLSQVRAAADAWPRYTSVYTVPMQLLHPRWGGSYEVMEGVARFAVERTQKELGAAMYAIAYERVVRGSPRETIRDTNADWDLMKKGFRDLEQRGKGQPWIWANFAQLACHMRDRDEARRLYEVNDRLRPEQKGAVHPCRTFAAGK